MKEFQQAREEYEAVPIPPELDQRVRAGIRQGKAARRRRSWQRSLSGLAACVAVLVGILNLSPTVAAAAAEVPVLGGLFQVLTVREFQTTQDGIRYDVNVPEVESGADLAQKVNTVIQEKVESHMAQARQDWADYREAFFATGGTEEEWGDREMDVIVDYEIMSQTDTQVSFVVTFAEGWVSSMEERFCYNLNLAENRELSLQDLLGEDWVSVCNQSIQAQIDASADEDGFTYFFSPDEGGFTTVDESTAFYIREDGVPVVMFPRYAIAAGAAGFPVFPIQLPAQ